jgi:hypothetical protein
LDAFVRLEFDDGSGRLDRRVSVFDASPGDRTQLMAEFQATARKNPQKGAFVTLHASSHEEIAVTPLMPAIFRFASDAHREIVLESDAAVRLLANAVWEAVRVDVGAAEVKDYAGARLRAADPEWTRFCDGEHTVCAQWKRTADRDA